MQTLVLTRSDAVALSLLLSQSLSVHVHLICLPLVSTHRLIATYMYIVVLVKFEFEAVAKQLCILYYSIACCTNCILRGHVAIMY